MSLELIFNHKRVFMGQLLKKHLMVIHHTRPFYVNHKRVYRLNKSLYIQSLIPKKHFCHPRFFNEIVAWEQSFIQIKNSSTRLKHTVITLEYS